MPGQKDLEHKHLKPWEVVAEAVWKRYPNAAKFPERLEVSVSSKRIGLELVDAAVERKVVYNYTEQIPLLLRTVVNPTDRFVMHETMRFDWVNRVLEIEAVNETGQPNVKYHEQTRVTVHHESDAWTSVKQTGFYEVDLIFGMDQLGSSMCEDIYNLNFFHNVNADVSLMQEFSRGSSNEVVGYFPTYLRQLFLENYDPAQLPPLPPPTQKASSDFPASKMPASSFEEKSLTDMMRERKMDEGEAQRKLAWMFSPTPPITKGPRGSGAVKLQVPLRMGNKGGGKAAMQPTLYPLQTFSPGTLDGPVAPGLEIYGVAREGAAGDSMMDQRGAQQAASSLVMF